MVEVAEPRSTFPVALNCPPTVVEPRVAKLVVVALVRSVLPKSVVEASCAPPVALKAPLTVEEPVMARLEVVPLPREKARPVMSP